ncbi:LOW QUALITY PROTEIN: Fanconi anemia group I protein homolog [Drosophila tropicalis]|uniref:LOW QUALITY PROTEIN: Fanconi anemia group I protein homolog n=1 Tax=Drosophila tropicalis TaxID=46794 RepID=UPI0035AC03EC
MSDVSLEFHMRKLGEKGRLSELEELVHQTSIRELTKTLSSKLPRSDCINFWNYLLLACNTGSRESCEKRFACVCHFLDGLRTVELSYKQTFDLIARLSQDLVTFSPSELVWIVDHCVDGLRLGDAKCVGWKDLLPETLAVLAATPQFLVNGVSTNGPQYRNNIINSLSTMRWPATILTPIADMFRALHLSNAEILTVLNKFAGALQELSPMELPALCFQLFSMCNSASKLIIPLLALEKYFHRNYYKRLFSDMCSNSTDLDSIDSFSDKELREAEETILHHLNYCTMYKLTEQHMVIMLRNFLCMPDVILTPFMLSAIISMTSVNRDPDSAPITRSLLLSFLRNVIKNNENERKLADYSVWCRDAMHRRQVDLQQVFSVLLDQNKEGKDVITPGLTHLAFVLLKSHQAPKMHILAITFLTKFIRKRYQFGQGMIKKIANWMVVYQDQNQFSECLTMLSVADTYTVSECLKAIQSVMEHMLWIPGEQAMRMMNFILPLLKLSNRVRDALIKVLCKAMGSSDLQKRRMAIYGFCMILKQLNNSNSLRQTSSSATSFCTQHSISGYSMMTQSTLGSRSNPQRNFDMLTLEIIGILRNCLQQQFDIRCTLYENLQRAVELNAKLVPHILQVIDWHFRSFFETSPAEDQVANDVDSVFRIRYDLMVSSNDDMHMSIQLKDNLGQLVQFVSQCLAIFERSPYGYDASEMQRLLTLSVQRLVANRLNLEDTAPPATHLKCALVQQQLHFIEGIISHILLSSKPTNEIITNVLPLFKQHDKLRKDLQTLAGASKKSRKRAKPNDSTQNNTTVGNLTVNGVQVKSMCISTTENIWDLCILDRFLHLLHDDIVPFAAPEKTTQLRSHEPLVRYVLEITALKVEHIRLEPDYKQMTYSKRTLKQLTDITKTIYERCIRRLPDLWRDFDMQTAELAAKVFLECLRTAHCTYEKRFKEFVKGFDMATLNNKEEAIYIVQNVIEEFMKEDSNGDLIKDAPQLPIHLLESLEILYDHVDFGDRAAAESYTWLLNFCRSYELPNADFGLVHRLLFTQRQKTHSGSFFDGIARQLGQVLGYLNDKDQSNMDSSELSLKSLSTITAGSCLQHLYSAVHKQLEDVDYFIMKANNLNYKCQLVSDSDQVYWRGNLDALDRSICTQIIYISRTLMALTNVCIPMGSMMDGLLKLLIQHYTCMKNLAKHYLSWCTTDDSIGIVKSTKFELLLREVGQQLPANFYDLINYIEANTLDDESKQQPKKRQLKAERAKVLRETRLIPKVIMVIEDFNKQVIILSKKCKKLSRLTDHLHLGTIRDFDIQSGDLRAAIERSLSESYDIDEDSNQAEDQVEDQGTDVDEAEDDEEEIVAQKPQTSRRRRAENDADESQPKRKRVLKEKETVQKKSAINKKTVAHPPPKQVEDDAESSEEDDEENEEPVEEEMPTNLRRTTRNAPSEAKTKKPTIARRVGLQRSNKK